MKETIKSLLAIFNYELKKKPKGISFPVEFSDDDCLVVKSVIDSKLSMASNERLFATLLACKYVCKNNISGDFVECGVWRGGNSIIAANVFKRYSVNKKVYLFDTFSGMSAPTDFDAGRDGKKAIIKYLDTVNEGFSEWCYCPADEVLDNFKKLNLENFANLIIGDVGVTLKNLDNIPDQIAILRLDTDWYESTLVELEILYPKLVPGGVLIIDDYGHWQGARRAVDEYFSRLTNPPLLNYTDYTGRIAIKY